MRRDASFTGRRSRIAQTVLLGLSLVAALL